MMRDLINALSFVSDSESLTSSEKVEIKNYKNKYATQYYNRHKEDESFKQKFRDSAKRYYDSHKEEINNKKKLRNAQKVTCPECNREFVKCSLNNHIKNIHKKNKKVDFEKIDFEKIDINEIIN